MKLRDYVREHKLPDVYFFGFRNQSELPKFYSIADVFVFPSASETWGLILNEVMCAGVPVIAARDIGAVPDLVRQGENGFAFEPGNIDELVSYMHQLLKSSELRTLMGKQSLNIISHWDHERCVLGVRTALEYVAREHTWGAASEPA
jgi:glycosyltransferase involved in cell wall biosynthesis